ncbi:MAG: glycosyltransferase [Blastocatellia bacterium]
MKPLKVLITNNALGERAGSELYVRDLALGLLRRGHTPILYSTVLGEVADELRIATIPIVDNLESMSIEPDIIHGHHHLETMTALLRFPSVPAIYLCHGWIPWEEAPPKFPRVLRYLAVDDLCRERLVIEHGIPDERVGVLLNFVDLDRFRPRPPLLGRPRRGLVFTNQILQSRSLEALRQACELHGIELETIGRGFGAAHSRPEDILANYDIVFAKARAAMEALAVGTAVVLYDKAGLGPMVTSEEFDRLRSLNFGIRTLAVSRVTTEAVEDQISRYDPVDAARVSSRIRAEAGCDAVVENLISLYQEVIWEFGGEGERGERDMASEGRAAAGYLRWLSPWFKNSVSVERALAETQKEAERAIRERDHVHALLEAELEKSETLDHLDDLAQALQLEQHLEPNQLRTPDDIRRAVRGVEQLKLERDEAQAELQRIRGTLGWRMLRPYGRIKHHILLPMLRRLSGRRAAEK